MGTALGFNARGVTRERGSPARSRQDQRASVVTPTLQGMVPALSRVEVVVPVKPRKILNVLTVISTETSP